MNFISAGAKQAEKWLVRSSAKEIEMGVVHEAGDLGAAGLKATEKKLVQEGAALATEAVENAAKNFKPQVLTQEGLLKLARVNANNVPKAISAVGLASSKVLPAAAIAYTTVELGKVPGRVMNWIGEGGKQVIGEVHDVVEGMRNEIPSVNDIEDVVKNSMNAAHDFTASIPIAESALSIGAVLLGAVILYESYRFFV